ncbi:MAG: alpha/beta fold hydrolase [Fulvimonas sp.]|nr:alpha/beta fold hydrolase [Fulvimonas sp.]
MSENNPELGKRLRTGDFETNVHDRGQGPAVLLIHGSGPGVSAWANWRPVLPVLAERFRVIAPDMVGFGYTERPAGIHYDLDTWCRHALAVLDALGVERAHIVGNSFGGALALALATRHPERVGRLVLMGSAGLSFPITPGLDAVWGYTPSVANMRKLLDIFAYNRALVNDELAELRYRASTRPGVQEAYAAMFPAPRQRSVDALATPEEALRKLDKETLIIHGREDQVIPLESSYRLHALIGPSQLHVFGHCGHWTQIEQTARFNRLVTDFFAEAGQS